MTEARAAEQERAAGEMAKRTEQIKGLVAPVQEKLGRMESEIGRLERERREAQGDLQAMVRQLGEGVGTLRKETGMLVPGNSFLGATRNGSRVCSFPTVPEPAMG